MTGPRFTILLYHGVHADDLAQGDRNRSAKHVPQARFAAEMARVATEFPVITMDDIGAALRGERTLTDGSVAVTFDDGFRNNFTHAYPVLREAGVPATIYLATGYIGTGRRMWSDRLEVAFLDSSARNLEIETPVGRLAWNLESPEERVASFLNCKSLGKTLPNDQKDELVDTVVTALDPPPRQHPLYDFMDWDEVRDMAASGLVTFGAHTVDHVSLARVGDEEIAWQIDTSLADVRREVHAGCTRFAYPEGQADDYDERVTSHLAAIGIDHAPTAIPGTNALGAVGPYDLYRTMVGFEGAPFPL